MSGSAAFALYVHMPWCRHICPYCDFNVYRATTPPADAFVRDIASELDGHLGRSPWTGRAAGSVYLGGGTPSLLPPSAVATLVDHVRRTCGIVAGAEVTIEANPGTVTLGSLRGYREAGVTRVSLGAQSFSTTTLATLGRDHTPAAIRDATDAARAAGFDNLSLDLIYGAPGSTISSWANDVEQALALSPDHVSVYGLTYEERTPFFKRRARGELIAVDEDTELAMARLADEGLTAAGLLRYEISSWARPGFAARHNGAYWDGTDYLGLGPGAHSFTATPPPGRRMVNHRRPETWAAAVRARADPIAQTEELMLATARGEAMMTGLRRIVGIDRAAFHARFGVDVREATPQIEELVADGLLDCTATHVRLTARGLLLADTVAARLL